MKKTCFKILMAALMIVCMTTIVYGSVAVTLSDQASDVREISSDNVATGIDLEVTIYDAASGGNLLYNETFSNAITSGTWNVILGESTALYLEFGKIYYKDYVVGGEDMDYTNSTGDSIERFPFYSPLGDIQQGDLNLTDILVSIFTNDAGYVTNTTDVSFTSILSESWSNVTITESQISDLTHTTDTNTHVAGSGVYLYNDSTTMFLNETLMNLTISDLDTDTQLNEGQVDGFVANNGYLVNNTDVTVNKASAEDWTNVSITESQVSDLQAYLLNSTDATLNKVGAEDWTNVTITESQISDLSHTVDTNESAAVASLMASSGNWNESYDWGDHSVAGYLTGNDDVWDNTTYNYWNIYNNAIVENGNVEYSTILAGTNNYLYNGSWSAIIAGEDGVINCNEYALIGTGYGHEMGTGTYGGANCAESAILAGEMNYINSKGSSVLAGQGNRIESLSSDTRSYWSAVLSGRTNYIYAGRSLAILSGENHVVNMTNINLGFGAILSGDGNTLGGHESVVLGGTGSTVTGGTSMSFGDSLSIAGDKQIQFFSSGGNFTVGGSIYATDSIQVGTQGVCLANGTNCQADSGLWTNSSGIAQYTGDVEVIGNLNVTLNITIGDGYVYDNGTALIFGRH